MADINLKINGIAVSVPEGTTILNAARSIGIKIPTLCYMKEINEIGACRICVVEVKGARSLVTACVYPVAENMEVTTDSKKIFASRKSNIELLLSDHNKSCLNCVRSGKCELQQLSQEYACNAVKYRGKTNDYPKDESTSYLTRDNTKCILCRRCIAVCKKQQVAVIGANARGFDTHVGCTFEKNLGEVSCIACGQCTVVCPTAALTVKNDMDLVKDALSNPDLYCVAAPAPATRVAIGEEFGFPVGTNTEGKLCTSLKRLGFKMVSDIDFAADLTVMEEGFEFIGRLKNGGVLPQITSCSPGWINYCEQYYPEFISNLSTCKSPMAMQGAITKTYYAQKMGIDPKKIFFVGIMPCTAKKFESKRGELSAAGVPDVDAVLTTREYAELLRRSGVAYAELPDTPFDNPIGESTGAAVIFGVTGGVMEAALRTVVEKLEGKPLAEKIEFVSIRGQEGIKEATYKVAGIDVNICVASGTANAKKVLNSIKSGEKKYHFIEIMCCPSGCVNGGGQPLQDAEKINFGDVAAKRLAGIYGIDKNMPLRQSHHNPSIKKLYDEFLGEPNGHKAHEILHTHFTKREKN